MVDLQEELLHVASRTASSAARGTVRGVNSVRRQLTNNIKKIYREGRARKQKKERKGYDREYD